ncbi:hypothetical protein E8E13_010085 [Curvularia kusanoi]|uniref:Apple domain-containing protein n=1 Tax=Curvularia kusanoi TaxID=90978 RepID=A0A9P4WBN7_CURKU|nr:hypothetical protein E8E13_010085 [Curvularia kusanoi]
MAASILLQSILMLLLLGSSSSGVAASPVGSKNDTASFSGSLTGDVSDTSPTGSWCTFAQGEIYKELITHCGLDFYGGDVGNFRVYDVDQCAELCDITPDCIAVSYQKSESGELKGRCWLKNEITSTQRFDSSILGMHKKDISYTAPDWLEPKTASHARAHAVVPLEWSPTPLTSAPRDTNVSTTCSSSASTAYGIPSGYSSSETLSDSGISSSWMTTSIFAGPSSGYDTVHTCYSPGCLSIATPLSPSPSSSSQYSSPVVTYWSTAIPLGASTKDPTSSMVEVTKSINTKGTSTQYPTVSLDHSWTSASSWSNTVTTSKYSSGYGQTFDVTTSTTWTTRHVTDEVTTTTVVYRPASTKSSVHAIYSTLSATSTSKAFMSTVEPSRQTSHYSTGASGSKTTKSPVPIISSAQTTFSTLWTTVVFTDESTTTTVVYRPASTKTSTPAIPPAKTASTTTTTITSTIHVPPSTQTPASTSKVSSQYSRSSTGATRATSSGFWMPSTTTSYHTKSTPTTSPVHFPQWPSPANSPTPSSEPQVEQHPLHGFCCSEQDDGIHSDYHSPKPNAEDHYVLHPRPDAVKDADADADAYSLCSSRDAVKDAHGLCPTRNDDAEDNVCCIYPRRGAGDNAHTAWFDAADYADSLCTGGAGDCVPLLPGPRHCCGLHHDECDAVWAWIWIWIWDRRGRGVDSIYTAWNYVHVYVYAACIFYLFWGEVFWIWKAFVVGESLVVGSAFFIVVINTFVLNSPPADHKVPDCGGDMDGEAVRSIVGDGVWWCVEGWWMWWCVLGCYWQQRF